VAKPNQQRLRVVAGLVRRGATVLLQQRPAGKARAGAWEFPGGKVEAGESEEEALAREWLEELGVTIEVGECVWQGEHSYEDLRVHLLLYRVELVEGGLQPRDQQQLRWIPVADLPAVNLSAADRPAAHLVTVGEI